MIHYLDNAATTPVREEAVQAALAAMTEGWGNPSARYALGSQAAGQLTQWRGQVAKALGCLPEEVIFTSCGTESDNWAIQAALELNRRKGKHIITTAIEHAAILEPCKALERQGYEGTYLQPDRQGNISLEELERALRPDTVLVSCVIVMGVPMADRVENGFYETIKNGDYIRLDTQKQTVEVLRRA